MALYKFCRCGKKILIENKFCNVCKAKEDKYARERYKTYAKKRIDKKEQSFYNSERWENKRDFILDKYNHIDIYAFYNTGIITLADTVHHIIEIKEDWEKRLDNFNLFCCNKENHKKIHDLYLTNKEECRKMLLEMNEKYRKEFDVKFDVI